VAALVLGLHEVVLKGQDAQVGHLEALAVLMVLLLMHWVWAVRGQKQGWNLVLVGLQGPALDLLTLEGQSGHPLHMSLPLVQE